MYWKQACKQSCRQTYSLLCHCKQACIEAGLRSSMHTVKQAFAEAGRQACMDGTHIQSGRHAYKQACKQVHIEAAMRGARQTRKQA